EMQSISALLIATTNPGKLREIREVLSPLRLLTLADCAPLDAPEETGTTFAENALLKARYYGAATGLPTVGEDAGLEIDALGGAPGIESARFGGVGSSYPEKFARLFTSMKASGTDNRRARYVCALSLVNDGRLLFETSATVEGEIVDTPRGGD